MSGKVLIRIEIESELASQLLEATNLEILELLILKEQLLKLNQEENRLVNIGQRIELMSRKLNELAIVVHNS